MKPFIGGLVFAFLSFFTGYAQIIGSVSNSQTGEAVELAQIYLPQLDNVVYSDVNGSFTLNSTPSIPFNIVVSLLGYETKEVVVSSSTISINLNPSVFEMEEVIVSTPFSNLENQNTISVSKINSETLQESGASVLADALQRIPGVSAISSGPGIAKPVIRGLSGNRVVTYVNDLRYENYQFGADHGLDIGTTAKSVEVIKGPFSLLYGSDAIGGVIYISPQDFTHRESLTGSLQQRYLSQSFGNETSATIGIAKGKWQFGANGSQALHADYETSGDYLVPNSRFKANSAGFNTRFSEGDYQLTMRLAYADKQAGIVEERRGGKRNFNTQIPFQETQLNQFSLRQKLNTSIGLWNLTTGVTINKRREFEDHDADELEEEDHEDELVEDPHDEEGAALNMRNRVVSLDLNNTLPVSGNWQQIAGIQWLEQENTNSGVEMLIPNALQRDYGVYWLHQFTSEKLKWQLGLRYDIRSIKTEAFTIHHHEEKDEEDVHDEEAEVAKIDKNFTSLNGSLGLIYPISENTQIRVNASTGYRAPNLAELTSYGVHHGAQRFEVGNANLMSEKNLQIDLGFDIQTTHLNLGIDGFYNAINDYIFLNPSNEFEDGLQIFEYEQSNANLWGGEFYAHYHPQGKIHFETSLEFVKGEQDNGTALPLIPPLSLNQEVHWNISDVFASFVSLTIVDKQDDVGLFETKTNGYEVIDFGSHIDISITDQRELRLQLLVRNIANKKYIPHLSRLKTIGVEQPGRNIVISAKYTF